MIAGLPDQLPAVAILIPTYNRRALLGEAIASAQRQTYAGPLQIIVLDDHSPDDTAAAVEPFLSDPRVRYVRHPINVGIARNWQIGIGLVEGNYFCLLHDDDTFEPTFVERLVVPLLADPDLILSFSDHWVMSANGVRLPAESDAASVQFHRSALPPGPVEDFARVALVDLAIPVGATVFRRSMVTPDLVDPAAKGASDVWLLYQCVRTAKHATYVDDRLMNYRLHPGSMSSGMPLQMTPGHIHRLTTALSDTHVQRLWPEFRRQLGDARVGQGAALLAIGHLAAAKAELRKAAFEYPTARGLTMLVAVYMGRPGQLMVRAVRRIKRSALSIVKHR